MISRVTSGGRAGSTPPGCRSSRPPLNTAATRIRVFKVGFRHVVDAVLERAVRAHIVDHAARRDHDAVAALLDPLDMAVQRVVRHGGAVAFDPIRASTCPRRSGAPAASGSVQPASTGGGIVAVPAAVGRVRYGNLAREHRQAIRALTYMWHYQCQ